MAVETIDQINEVDRRLNRVNCFFNLGELSSTQLESCEIQQTQLGNSEINRRCQQLNHGLDRRNNVSDLTKDRLDEAADRFAQIQSHILERHNGRTTKVGADAFDTAESYISKDLVVMDCRRQFRQRDIAGFDLDSCIKVNVRLGLEPRLSRESFQSLVARCSLRIENLPFAIVVGINQIDPERTKQTARPIRINRIFQAGLQEEQLSINVGIRNRNSQVQNQFVARFGHAGCVHIESGLSIESEPQPQCVVKIDIDVGIAGKCKSRERRSEIQWHCQRAVKDRTRQQYIERNSRLCYQNLYVVSSLNTAIFDVPPAVVLWLAVDNNRNLQHRSQFIKQGLLNFRNDLVKCPAIVVNGFLQVPTKRIQILTIGPEILARRIRFAQQILFQV